jgi:hypothetical protein
MNKRKNRKGYIAIEAVIAAGFIMAVGLFAMMNFSSKGTETMTSMTGRLDGLLSGDTSETASQLSDFQFEDLGHGYRITGYSNTTGKDIVIPADKDIVIPAEYNGKPIIEIGE